jgi:glycosyltransferase involved in cell wall biosynthesis
MKNRDFKVLGVLLNLELTKKNVSGTRNMINVALRKYGHLLDIIDVDIYGLRRKWHIIRNYSPDMESWRFKFHLDTKMRELRSARAAELINRLESKPDATMQIGSEFNLEDIQAVKGVPRFSYHDSNLHAYLRGAWKLPKARQHIARALAYEKNVYDGLTGVFTMSEFLRQIFIQDFGLPEEKVHFVGVGFNMEKVLHGDREYDGKTILFTARHLFEQKGGKVVISAFQRVRREIPDARLLLVGQALNIDEPGIEVLDFIDKSTPEGLERLRRLYLSASIFVMPTYYDAFGNVFLEAMAHKVPCLGADCCAMPEIIVGNNAGFVVPPGDATSLADRMIEMLSDQSMLRQMGENGLNAVRKVYSWEVVHNKVNAVMAQYV